MTTKLLTLVVFLLTLASLRAEDKPADTVKRERENFARVQGVLGKVVPFKEIAGLDQDQPLEKVLQTLQKQLPMEWKITLRIDAAAFGKDLPKVAGAMIMSPSPETIDVPLQTVLQGLLRRLPKDIEAELAIRENAVVITRPRLAAFTLDYEVRDVIQQFPQILPDLEKYEPELFGEGLQGIAEDRKLIDSQSLLVRMLLNEAELRSWETLQILNGSRLTVNASPSRQRAVDSILFALRRLADLAVIMNARLYEVDRAFYKEHVLPLLNPEKDPEDRPTIIGIGEKSLQRITLQKLLLESDELKLQPNLSGPFLSRRIAFRFNLGPKKEGGTIVGTGLQGVSFDVLPQVSPDRRYIRLQVTQQVADLVRIDKATERDVFTGKDVKLEVPNVRKSSLTGTVTLPDGGAFLMPVAYRPPGKENEDKVWLLVARPIIYIEAEEEERR